jgi:hypothetical protein
MTTSLANFRTEFHELVVQFLWRQWSVLGIAGAGGVESDDDWVIDPEALLLITSLFGRYDSRLFDQMMDWLCLNGRLISLVRLGNLYGKRRIGDPFAIAAIAETIGERAVLRKWKTAVPKWRTMIARVEDTIPQEPRPLFQRPNGESLPVSEPFDTVFVRYHYQRSPVQPRRMSQPPNPHVRANLWLKLRALFGVNARSDVMAWMLTHGEGHPGEMARRLAYDPKTLQDTLNEMELSGHLRSWREGREKHYAIGAEDWSFLATRSSAKTPPRWVDWSAVFGALDRVSRTLMDRKLESASGFVQAAELRELADRAEVGAALMRSGMLRSDRDTNRMTGTEFMTALIEDLHIVFEGREER